ncbi:hypothetical protein AOC36_09005 [Erysipelothrix larvae]|uniref:Peptidase M20 dimerisation domain-containing protein n=1 Tax=Erysipelothrix larvae TaxID=1514105 RepID=A0A0X8H127_9FIRM|nr:M20/M25/M40 family metallo-hydrolase [Erysipelothrix larvae]AMC94121.1 hypothetical protein AOC36_09005 [Erysipelothrix larvae]
MNINRMIDTFIEMVKIDSVSRNEGAFHDYLKGLFKDLGLEVYEDNTMETTGLGGNNLIFTLKGNTEGTPLFFSAHTDTVEPGVNIEPICVDGILSSKGDTILGADNKAGIAILVEMIRHIQENDMAHPTLEFVFTPGEEIGLVGAAALDHSKLISQYGLVLDSNGPVGGLTMASPTLMTLSSTIHGKSAHAGLEPEKGISSITVLADIINNLELGRLNANTTANVGVISGGSATNVVCDKAEMKAELRSIDLQEFEVTKQKMLDTIEAIASKHGATHETTTQILSQGYQFTQDMPFVQLLVDALSVYDLTPNYMVSGGGSDANAFNAGGKQAINISIGYEEIHTTNEYIPVQEMKRCVLLCLELIKRMAQGNHDLK